jgi:aldehyde dehydrogenase (NAD+)
MRKTSTEHVQSLLQRLGVAKALYTEGTLAARSPIDGAVTGHVAEAGAAEV